ncbi:adenine nucleotide translocase lysine N-methyltransferase [Eucyclogobius newberryi]|uniref:adenine nucleotide translocase lysine N-methyltransferase n=1 Tax=Eucyclogobius newberryi TaxID=166745 RepID=UPI003B5C8505
MEDSIEVILQDASVSLGKEHPVVTACTGALLTGVYGLWSLFALPGLRRVPWKLKVPYLPSSKEQTVNVMRLLQGRSGRLADLGSGDGRLVFAAASSGFRSTGFEINSILVAYARARARWTGLPSSHANFVKADFWKADLSSYNNVTAFLAPGAIEALGDKLLRELPDGAFVVSCRFPLSHWTPQSSIGSGLDQTSAYDISAVRAGLTKATATK